MTAPEPHGDLGYEKALAAARSLLETVMRATNSERPELAEAIRDEHAATAKAMAGKLTP